MSSKRKKKKTTKMMDGEEECSFLLDLFDDSSGDGVFGSGLVKTEYDEDVMGAVKTEYDEDAGFASTSEEGVDVSAGEEVDSDDADALALEELQENAEFIAADLFASSGLCPEEFLSLLDCDLSGEDCDPASPSPGEPFCLSRGDLFAKLARSLNIDI